MHHPILQQILLLCDLESIFCNTKCYISMNPYFPSISTNFPFTLSFSFHLWSSSASSRSTESASLRPHNMGPINVSPGTEFPPLLSVPHSHSPIGLDSMINVNWWAFQPRSFGTRLGFLLKFIAYQVRNRNDDTYELEDEQAAVGRLSSMSLIPAVTASGKTTLCFQFVFWAPCSVTPRRHTTCFCEGSRTCCSRSHLLGLVF